MALIFDSLSSFPSHKRPVLEAEAGMSALIRSRRLNLSKFRMDDADEVFACISPPVTRHMQWEMPASLAAFREGREKRMIDEERSMISLVVRLRNSDECIGMATVEGLPSPSPETGLWLKVSAQGMGYGREIVSAVVAWAATTLRVTSVIYPVALENVASRRIAEALGGQVVGVRSNPKYDSVIYAIPTTPGDRGTSATTASL